MAREGTVEALEQLVIYGGSMTSQALRMHPETSGLSVVQYRLFVLVVTNEGARVGELARLLGETPQHTSRLLRRLEDRGLVRTTRSESDRREVNIWATPTATRLWSAIGEWRRRLIREALEDVRFDDEVVASLAVIAGKFAREVS